MALLVAVYEERYSKFYVAPTFLALLESCHRLDLDTCVQAHLLNSEIRQVVHRNLKPKLIAYPYVQFAQTQILAM